MMKTTTVETCDFGDLVVCRVRDIAGNDRLVPIDGVPLAQWRDNPRLIPPWLLPVDLAGGAEAWSTAIKSLDVAVDHESAFGLSPED